MVERPIAEVWEIPRRVWFILLSWGMAGLLMSGLGFFWIWHNDRQQDKAMCEIIRLSIPAPAVAAKLTPEQREVVRAMIAYQATLSCPTH